MLEVSVAKPERPPCSQRFVKSKRHSARLSDSWRNKVARYTAQSAVAQQRGLRQRASNRLARFFQAGASDPQGVLLPILGIK